MVGDDFLIEDRRDQRRQSHVAMTENERLYADEFDDDFAQREDLDDKKKKKGPVVKDDDEPKELDELDEKEVDYLKGAVDDDDEEEEAGLEA